MLSCLLLHLVWQWLWSAWWHQVKAEVLWVEIQLGSAISCPWIARRLDCSASVFSLVAPALWVQCV